MRAREAAATPETISKMVALGGDITLYPVAGTKLRFSIPTRLLPALR